LVHLEESSLMRTGFSQLADEQALLARGSYKQFDHIVFDLATVTAAQLFELQGSGLSLIPMYKDASGHTLQSCTDAGVVVWVRFNSLSNGWVPFSFDPAKAAQQSARGAINRFWIKNEVAAAAGKILVFLVVKDFALTSSTGGSNLDASLSARGGG
jgi:hypothetical protein